jgi:hypothetical protein
MTEHSKDTYYPSYIQTETEKALWYSRERDRDCIRAMQKRLGGVLGIFHRKPWRSSSKWYEGVLTDNYTLRVRILNFLGWLRHAHDCSDLAVGCSCTGGYRFP